MLLAEVLIERDYIISLIDSLSNAIRTLVTYMGDEGLNKEKLEKLFERFEELYTKYQQFEIMISRAQAFAIVVINETEISLKDALIIRDIMNDKLKRLTNFLQGIGESRVDKTARIGVDNIEEMIDMIRLDIKTLDIKIHGKTWITEVK
jgi:hypothetical protein